MLAIEDRQDRSGASARIHSQAALGPSRRRGLNGGGNRGNPWFPCSYHGGGNGGTPGSPVRIMEGETGEPLVPLFVSAPQTLAESRCSPMQCSSPATSLRMFVLWRQRSSADMKISAGRTSRAPNRKK